MRLPVRYAAQVPANAATWHLHPLESRPHRACILPAWLSRCGCDHAKLSGSRAVVIDTLLLGYRAAAALYLLETIGACRCWLAAGNALVRGRFAGFCSRPVVVGHVAVYYATPSLYRDVM